MPNHNAVIFDGCRYSSCFSSNNDPLGSRRGGLAGEEGGVGVLGERVGVEMVVGGDQTGHLVGQGLGELTVGKVDPLGHSSALSINWSSVEGIHLEAKREFSSPGDDGGGGGRSPDLVEELLHDPVPLVVSYIVKQPKDTIRIYPSVCSLLGTIWIQLLFPVLPSVSLEPKKSVCPQICLNVILC